MRYIVEQSLNNFPFWSGGKDTADVLTYEELETLDSLLETEFADDCELSTDTEINDFFWFERDTIAGRLGYSDWEDLEANRD